MRSQLLLVLRHELRIFFRDRKAFVLGMVLPLFVFLVVGGVVALNSQDEDNERSARVVLAVPAGEPRLAELLRAAGGDAVKVVVAEDVERSVSLRKVDVGLLPPPGASALLREGAPLTATLVLESSRGKATVAAPLVESTLRRAALLGHEPPPPAPLVTVASVDAQRAPTAGRSLLIRFFPTLILLLAVPVSDEARSRLVAERSGGALEALLVLPIRRPALLSGVALASAIGALCRQALILGPAVVVAGLVAGAGDGSVAVGAGAVAGVVVASVGTSFLLAAVGVTIAAVAQENARVNATGPLISSVVYFGMLFVPLLGGLERVPALLPVPGIGALVLVRRGIAGLLQPTDLLVVAGVSALLAVLALRSAGRSLSAHGAGPRQP